MLVVAVFLAIVVLPIAWQRYREERARRSVQQNMEKLQQGIIKFERKNAADRSQDADVE
jgi:hypothetical protein